jgi:hypothetical protein
MMPILDHIWGVSAAQDRVWAQVSGLPPKKADARRLLALQAFIDESFSPHVFVLAGYIASAETWASFSKDWEELLPHSLLDRHGNWRFKMSEMVQTKDRADRAHAFNRLVVQYSDRICGVSVAFKIADHLNAIRRLWCLNGVIDWGDCNPYVFAVATLIDALCSEEVAVRKIIGDEKLDFIFDNRQAEKALIVESFDRQISAAPCNFRKRFGSTPRFESDEDFLPLQAADMYAWLVRKLFESGVDSVRVHHLEFSLNSPEQEQSNPAIIIEASEDQIANKLISDIRRLEPTALIYDKKFIGQRYGD